MSSNIKDLENDSGLAQKVLAEYNITPLGITLVQGGSIKTVWKILTGTGTLCLKRLKQTLDKALFSANAQIHIKQKAGNVPGIVLNKLNQAITQYNGQLFVMYEWLEGSDLNFGNSSDLKAAIQGLAKFHIYSKGYSPVESARISSKLGKWPEQYGSMLEKLSSWMDIASANISLPHYASFVRNTPGIIKMGLKALDLLKESKYEALTKPDSDSIVLCHQDYGKGNALLTNKGVYVLDLDGVTYDLPARDLRKIIGKNAENRNQWQLDIIEEICCWYEEVNPFINGEKYILYIDLLFPHWYYGLVKNLFQGGKAIKGDQIERIARLEQTKIPILNLPVHKVGRMDNF